ncbi:MAG: glutaredoxin 3 [Steroidobacteraceae bacterium]
MYCTDWCGYCARARRLLENKGVSIERIDIEAEPQRRAEMRQRSGRTSVPQIFIGTVHVGGYDDLKTLDDAGKLDPLLRGENNQ